MATSPISQRELKRLYVILCGMVEEISEDFQDSIKRKDPPLPALRRVLVRMQEIRDQSTQISSQITLILQTWEKKQVKASPPDRYVGCRVRINRTTYDVLDWMTEEDEYILICEDVRTKSGQTFKYPEVVPVVLVEANER